jgi:hypothetical protein
MAKNRCFHWFLETYFFLPLSTSPFLNRQIFWNRFSSPPILDQLRGTELAPLLNKDEEDGIFSDSYG